MAPKATPVIVHLEGQEFTVPSSHSVKQVKLKIQTKTGVPTERQFLRFIGAGLFGDSVDLVDDREKLNNYVCDKDTWILMHELFEINIKTETGKTITLDVKTFTRVHELKEMLQDKEGIPPVQQCLIFRGSLLDDRQTLAQYDIKKQSILKLEVRDDNEEGVFEPPSKRPRGSAGLFGESSGSGGAASSSIFGRTVGAGFWEW